MQALSELKTVLIRAATLADEVARKQDAVTEQETAALEALIELVRPLLPAIAAQVETAAHHSGQQFHKWKAEHLNRRGLILVDGFGEELTDKDYRGDYTGARLVLTADGALVKLERFGHWSNWQGEPSHWNTDRRTLTPAQAVEDYDFADIVSGLAAALKDAAGKQEKRAAGLEERLKVLEQVREALR
jgi:hypothetical protein